MQPLRPKQLALVGIFPQNPWIWDQVQQGSLMESGVSMCSSALAHQFFFLCVFPRLAEDLRTVCHYHLLFSVQALPSTADTAMGFIMISPMTRGRSSHYICSYLLED